MFNFLRTNKKKEQSPQFVIMNCVKSCGKEKCPIWVINYSNGVKDKKVADGRCGIAWIPVLMIETRQSIDRLTEVIQTGVIKNGDKK